MTKALQQQTAASAEPARLLAEAVAAELLRGNELVDKIRDEVYRDRGKAAGSIGSHIRHNLDFVDCFLRGLADSRIDYSARLRDEKTENDKAYAAGRVLEAAHLLVAAIATCSEEDLLVRSELDGSLWHRSSLERELEFLLSHTVHHYALVAEKLRVRGIAVPKDFGVAPSTLEFWKSKAAGSSDRKEEFEK